MPKKPDEEKLTGRILLQLGETLERQLRRAARENKTGPQEMLREAAMAIVRCHEQHKLVPKDMDVVQRRILPPTPEEFAKFLTMLPPAAAGIAAEAPQASYLSSPNPEALARIETAALEQELKRRQKLRGARPPQP